MGNLLVSILVQISSDLALNRGNLLKTVQLILLTQLSRHVVLDAILFQKHVFFHLLENNVFFPLNKLASLEATLV